MAAHPRRLRGTGGGEVTIVALGSARHDLQRLVDAIKAAVYENGAGLSVTEALGAIELAKHEILQEQGQ